MAWAFLLERKFATGLPPHPDFDIGVLNKPFCGSRGPDRMLRPAYSSEDQDEVQDDHSADLPHDVHEDRHLWSVLLAEQCAGPAWSDFVNKLAGYGHAVMMAWLISGEIFHQCKRHNCWPGEPPPYWEHEDMVGLSGDTVAKAIVDFRDRAVLGGEWRPESGASLKTYFITGCVYAFPNHYRKWRTEHDRRRRFEARTVDVDSIAGLPSGDDPADLVVKRLSVQAGLGGIKHPVAHKAIILQEMGYTLGEIAELLGVTRNVVKSALERHRFQGRRAVSGGDEDA
ncbi:RNA polymerase sigma factor [Umezawaea sp. NPDC059074]|uniref:RNA polymerase sigma factor n=1 Tax=Umezawaea sp. NPDC059074 TaxID=3346716 RepID=UPI0036C330EB